MASRQRDDFRDAATASTGAALLASGGVLRDRGVKRAVKAGLDEPKVHSLGMLKAPAGRKTFYGGSALGLVGLAPLAVGTTNLARPRVVEKSDQPKRRKFWREGVSGTKQALTERADTVRQDVPLGARGTQLAVALGAGAGGSALTRLALKGKPGLKPAVAPLGGALTATATVPTSSKIIDRRYPGYEVTPTGVRRQKKAPKPLSSARTMHQPTPRSFQADLAKSDDLSYLGSRTSRGTQRAAVTAAGHPPIVGPLTAAAAAGKYAPPGQERKHAARQWALGSGAGVLTGYAGARAGANLAEKNPEFERKALAGLKRVEGWENKARSSVGMATKERDFAKPPTKGLAGKVAGSKLGKPLFRSPAAAVGATAGFLGVKAATGAVGGQTAISLNQRDQSRYNAKHGIVAKSAAAPGTKAERRDLAGKKRASAVLSGAGGVAGLTGLTYFLRGRSAPAGSAARATLERRALGASTVGGGLGGTNALLNVPIQRKEAQAIDPTKVKKDAGVGTYLKMFATLPKDARKEAARSFLHGNPGKHEKLWPGKHAMGAKGFIEPPGVPKRSWVGKADSNDLLKPRYDAKVHQERIKQFGDKGPLPKGLDRRTRAQAYEARYLHHGGDKADRWQGRSETGEKVKNAGLGVATAGGAAYLASKTRAGRKLAAKHPTLRQRSDNLAVAGGVAGGAGEIYSGYAHRQQSRYANTPGGVAASSLRRMRAYDPDGD